MKQLSIQVQDDPDKLFSKIILDLLPEEYSEGYSDATTTTLGAEVEQEILEDIWNKISETLKKNSELANRIIATCTGQYGWDDYLLLHHFDKTEPLDSLLGEASDESEQSGNRTSS